MGFSLTPLLVHHDGVPREARDALRAASDGPPELRIEALTRAAHVLHREIGLDCGDVRELVGLPQSASSC
jgi:hypothetical protein